MAARPRVGLVTSAIDNRPARGTALVARRLLEQLCRFEQEFDFTLIHGEKVDDPLYRRWPEVIVPRLRVPMARDMLSESFGWVKMRSRGQRFDLIHYLQPRVWPSYLLAPSRRVAITIHEAGVMLNLAPPTAADYLFRFTNRWLHQRMDALITVSEFGRREVNETCRVPLGRIHVVPNGVDPTFSPGEVSAADSARLAEAYGLPERYILSVGRMDPHKNVLRLIQAYAEVRQRGVDLPLVIVGGRHLPEYTAQVEERIEQLGLRRFVTVAPFITDADLPDVYRAATALVYPSLHEGFGLPILEAMSCGTPVACSGTTALPEVAGGAALLFEPTDVAAIASAMHDVSTDAGLRERLIAAGLERARQFSWGAAADATAAIYRKLLS